MPNELYWQEENLDRRRARGTSRVRLATLIHRSGSNAIDLRRARADHISSRARRSIETRCSLRREDATLVLQLQVKMFQPNDRLRCSYDSLVDEQSENARSTRLVGIRALV